VTLAHGGGIRVKEVRFVAGAPVVAPRTPVTLEFRADEYLYGGPQYAYFALGVVPEARSLRPTHAALDAWDLYGITCVQPGLHPDLAAAAAPFSFGFYAPEIPGKYKAVIGMVPLFRGTPLKTAKGY